MSLGSQLHKAKVAIVGGGPSALYVAQNLVKVGIKVTIFDKNFSPHGLLRYGVAPDHLEIKEIATKFDKMIHSNPLIEFVGNASIPKDIKLDSLMESFNAVCLSYGSQGDNTLLLDNEGENVYSSREFVGWYNSDPTMTHITPNLSGSSAVIIGNGNVALDCARILLKDPFLLKNTDISSRALAALMKSNIQNVHIVARRGPLNTSFTSKEVRELAALDITLRSEETFLYEGLARPTQRLMDLLRKWRSSTEKSKSITLHFGKNCNKVVYENGLMKSILAADKKIESSLVIKAIGYRNQPMEGVPFDNEKGIIPSEKGKVGKGLYVSGWIKTGPVGVLTASLHDANETAKTIIKDLTEDLQEVKEFTADPSFITNIKWKALRMEEILKGEKILDAK